jgi:hypothetical protein
MQVPGTKDEPDVLLHIPFLPDGQTNVKRQIALQHLVLLSPIFGHCAVAKPVNLVFRQVGEIIQTLDSIQRTFFKVLPEGQLFRDIVVSSWSVST